MNSDKLSKRLERVAAFVPAQARLADIGSDHAYLPCYLAKNHKITSAIAGEVVEGPFSSAQHEIAVQGLTAVVEARLGNGLDVITAEDAINAITICGMGGTLICEILTAGLAKGKLATRPRLILQPNVAEPQVREWLQANHYQVIAEDLIAENDKFYEIIVADYTETPETLTATEIQFGKYLKAANLPVFQAKWRSVLERMAPVMANLRNSGGNQAKLQEFEALQQAIIQQLEG